MEQLDFLLIFTTHTASSLSQLVAQTHPALP